VGVVTLVREKQVTAASFSIILHQAINGYISTLLHQGIIDKTFE
jgi:hypothetical protein